MRSRHGLAHRQDDLPAANPGFLRALREVVPVLLRQRRDPEYHLRRELPPTARPYRPELHENVPMLGGSEATGSVDGGSITDRPRPDRSRPGGSSYGLSIVFSMNPLPEAAPT